MACNENRISNTCGKKTQAVCVEYQGELSENTLITDQCVNVEEVIEDIITLVDGIKEEIDLSGLTGGCLTLPSDLKTNTLFQFLITTICAMQEQITALEELTATQQEQIEEIIDGNCPPTP